MPALSWGHGRNAILYHGTGSRLLCYSGFILMNTCILNKKLPVEGFIRFVKKSTCGQQEKIQDLHFRRGMRILKYT